MIDQYTFENREAETARREALAERRERFEAPAAITPVKPRLMDKLREQFWWGTDVKRGGALQVVRYRDGETEWFVYSVAGAMSATCWMVERMGEQA